MNNAAEEEINPFPYTSIPGPSFLELILFYLPGGKFYKKNLQEKIRVCRETYGDLVRIPSFFGIPNLVISHKPEHFQIVYRTEGQYPERRNSEIIKYYEQKIRPDIHVKYKGILNMQGEEWSKMRKLLNPLLMQPRNLQIYLPRINQVAMEFLERIQSLRDPTTNQLSNNFETEISCWALESIGVIALDERLGVLTDKSERKVIELMTALKDAFDLGQELSMKPPVWKIIATRDFKKFVEAMNRSTDIVIEYIEKAIVNCKSNGGKSIKNSEPLSILAKLINVNENAAVGTIISMFFAGVDTVSSAFVSILYALAKNKEKQEKLRSEIHSALPERSSQFSVETFRNLPYLRACFKESQRLYPTVSNHLRSAGQDLILSGYKIPKRTQIIMNTGVLAQEEQYFPKPSQFIPERWLRHGSDVDNSSTPSKSPHSFIFMPFGFGVAEMELEVMISMIIRNFKISWDHPDMTFNQQIINSPDSELMFTLTTISD